MPKYSIGNEQRDGTLGNRHLLGTPAPNVYNPSKVTLTRNPSWVVGSGQRNPLTGSLLTPGPGNYNIPAKITEGPKVRIMSA